MNEFTATYLDYFNMGIQKVAVQSKGSKIVSQRYMPLQDRRETLEPEEEEMIAQAKKKVMPKMYPSEGDHPSVEMSDPKMPGVVGGLKGSLIGSIGGAYAGLFGGGITMALNNDNNMDRFKKIMAGTMGAGAITGALLGGMAGYKGQISHNDTTEDRIRRLPPGAKRRDMMSDPAYQAEMNRQAGVTEGRSGY